MLLSPELIHGAVIKWAIQLIVSEAIKAIFILNLQLEEYGLLFHLGNECGV